MKRSILVAVFLVTTFAAVAQMSPWSRAYDMRPYSMALTLTNPANAMSRLGVGIEYRRRNYSYMSTYNLYNGVYTGKMQDFIWTFYLRKHWVHRNRKWYYQDFVYVKLFGGDSEYFPNKFNAIGLPTADDNVYYEYIGVGSGYGRRYQRGIFFVTVKGGLRGTYTGLTEEDKLYYRLFYITGPGSIIECTANFGIQI